MLETLKFDCSLLSACRKDNSTDPDPFVDMGFQCLLILFFPKFMIVFKE